MGNPVTEEPPRHDNDLCACGDYRRQHVGGTGACKLGDLCTPYHCKTFRLDRPAEECVDG